jgi:hypothetical protein
MRVLLDENLPVGLATLLGGDHQVFTIAGVLWQGVDDMKIIEEGTRGVALAPERGKVPVVFEYRDLTLDSGVVVKDVLVGVAAEGSVGSASGDCRGGLIEPSYCGERR